MLTLSIREDPMADGFAAPLEFTAQIEAEKAKALAELRRSMGGVATDLAGRIVGESMTDDARASAVVDRFIAELEQAGQNGGQN